MFNKNDPLINAVQGVMKQNQAERNAVRLVNEKFGIQDRKALPHEKQGEWDAAYKAVLSEGLHPNQQKLDVHEPEKDKLTSQDFKMLRSKKKPMEEENAPKTDPYAEGQASSISTVTVKPKAKAVTPADQKALADKINTIKEEEQIDEKAPPGAKYERMVKHIKKKLGKDGLTGKEKSIAYATAWKAKNKNVNEGFNIRHDLSVTASDENQVVVGQLNEKVGVPLAARQKQQQVKKDMITTNKRLAREPKEAPSSIGSKIRQAAGATNAAVSGFANQALMGKEIAAGADYAAKNTVGRLFGGKGTTYDKEYKQEVEKETRQKLNYPTASGLGDAAGNIANVASVGGLVKSGAKYVAKKIVKGSADNAATAAPKLLPKPTSTAAQTTKAPTAVDNFIAKAKSTPVSPAARETGDAAAKAAANAAKYTNKGARGNFTDNLANARKNAGSDPKARQLPTLRGTTQPTNYVRPNVPAVKPAASTALARPGMPNLAAGGPTRIVGLSNKGKAVVGGAALAAGAGAAYMANKSGNAPAPASAATAKDQSRVPPSTSPNKTQATPAPAPAATTPPKPKVKPAQQTTTAAPTPKAKPAAPAATARPAAPAATKPAAPVQRKAAPQNNSTPAQRSYQNRQIERGNAAPGTKNIGLGVSSGTKTGTTITSKPKAAAKAPVGTGRVK